MDDAGPGAPAPTPAPADASADARIASLRARCNEAADVLKAIANPDRLLLLCALIEAERSVAELGRATGVRQPTLSQQLGVLRSQRLVATRRAGRSIHYRLEAPGVRSIIATLHRIYGMPVENPVH